MVVVVLAAVVLVVDDDAAVGRGRREWSSWSCHGLLPGEHLDQSQDGRARRLGQLRPGPGEAQGDELAVVELEAGRLQGGRPAGFRCSCWPFLTVLVVSTQERALTSADLPGVGRARRALVAVLVEGGLADGVLEEVLVSVKPVYSEANLPRVALLPASLELFGAIRSTP